MRLNPIVTALALASLAALGCKRDASEDAGSAGKERALAVGLVTDVGGRGDQSFNDSAIRGLERWAAGIERRGADKKNLSAEQLAKSLPADLNAREPRIEPLAVRPLVLESRSPEDYEPNLQLLVDQGVSLVVGVGFMLENAIETVARRNPDTRFLLIDSPILDEDGAPYTLDNVRSVSFREEQGSYLVGALAALTSQTGKVGFVGGMEIPLIKKFEAGFKAGVAAGREDDRETTVLVNYTGSFDNVAAGKQIAQDLLSKGVDVVFHAAGTDGLGVIKAVEDARSRGKTAYAIGVDSDQSHVAPEAVLTSMVKRVDLAVYDAVRALKEDRFEAGHHVMGLEEQGVAYAEIRVDLEDKDEKLARVEALRLGLVDGSIHVPTTAP